MEEILKRMREIIIENNESLIDEIGEPGCPEEQSLVGLTKKAIRDCRSVDIPYGDVTSHIQRSNKGFNVYALFHRTSMGRRGTPRYRVVNMIDRAIGATT